MHKVFRLLAIAGLLAAPLAQADVLTLPDAPSATAHVPARGLRQAEVVRQFGEPLRRHPPAGGGTPAQPPITRWDYDGWSVFFENNIVIDTVVEGAPAPVHNADLLRNEP